MSDMLVENVKQSLEKIEGTEGAKVVELVNDMHLFIRSIEDMCKDVLYDLRYVSDAMDSFLQSLSLGDE